MTETQCYSNLYPGLISYVPHYMNRFNIETKEQIDIGNIQDEFTKLIVRLIKEKRK